MKNLVSYLAIGIPLPSCSKRMVHTTPKRVRSNTERQERKSRRNAKRGAS